MPPIKGHTVLVIGGSSGIGLAVAQLAASEGCRVFVASSSPARVQAAVDQIRHAVPGAQIAGRTCDVSQDDAEANLEKLLADVTTSAAGGTPIDHIVYTANQQDRRPLAEVAAPWLRASTQFSFVVPLLLAKVCGRHMRAHHASSMTFTSGRIGERPLKGTTVLAARTSGFLGLVKGLALDLAPVRANLVCPGAVDTPLLGTGAARERMIAAFAGMSPLGRIGTPEEVAEAYIYLMKDWNNTGSSISTSAGTLIQ
ncbi:hypothetical protein F4778DRAFT_799510 [Xylariomycetidae sp. FL2044]|nr:hypothetical protein F4778DRAFT_799510 [Xylariomycetidae sp. FL2044]